MNTLRLLAKPMVAMLLPIFILFMLVIPISQAGIISNDQLLSPTMSHNGLNPAMSRADILAQLDKLGINDEQLQQRIEHMTAAELAEFNDKMDELPAGQGILGTAVFLFLVLLVTDILGFTDIFPFVKKH